MVYSHSLLRKPCIDFFSFSHLINYDLLSFDYGCATDPQKQFGGPAVRADSGLHQPIGLPVAMTAANVMAGALGGAQTGIKSNQNGLQTQQGLGTDPLTLHLAKLSRNQLNEILSELKVSVF